MHWEQVVGVVVVVVDVSGKERVKENKRKPPNCNGPSLEAMGGALCRNFKYLGQTCKTNCQTTLGRGEKQGLAAVEGALSPSLQGHKVLLNPN